MSLGDESYGGWIGKEERRTDKMDPWVATAMAAMLDQETSFRDGDALPHLWHWLYFRSSTPRSGLGQDGHGKKGGFLPPVALPRRMWAGGELNFHAPVLVGEPAERVSTIETIEEKTGRSGPLVFVTVRHDILSGGKTAVVERQRLVYREAAPPGQAAASPRETPVKQAGHQRIIHPDPVLMFRYSALTFNGHRIHYDRDYSTKVEGYPGLVFHGPLTATLLMGLLCEEVGATEVRRFSYQAKAPLFDLNDFSVNLCREGDKADLWASDHKGLLSMSAFAETGPAATS